MTKYVVFASFGNDSVALCQWFIERREQAEVTVVYLDTGWAAPEWVDRVNCGMTYACNNGFNCVTVQSEGFKDLVRRKKAFPRNGLQFCTEELKIKPALKWLELHDIEKEAVCVVGIRREESRARAQWPEWVEESDRHGGRSLWSPLVNVKEAERNELCKRAGFEVLAHRSWECYPCINSNRANLRLVSEERIQEIENLETEMGYTGKGKPIAMFRPYRHQGATGIREVIRWARADRGKYDPDNGGCDSGMCGES